MPTASSVCEHQINSDMPTVCNGRLLDAPQMALRPSSDLDLDPVVRDLDPTAVRDLLHCSVYDPELSVLENPEYFHANSELFAAHQLLLQRYGRMFFKN